ncbi:hypothetical protein [Pacificimonas flava]|uniref:Uncharacterized protein n=1 Tax=Pacificimonas flava TaxID=1234595 RepID=M2SA61_9SPHN|nr:hypothetical protein [Pacificimonas flava]EMD82265.1 hypothetical protein C725_2303 [Pacificimonas flava]MBB5280826.1 hypothetical protein [Pacificimonas flava]
MSALRLLIVLTLIAAGFATAASAGHRDYRRHRGGDGFDVGDAIIGAAVVGGIIAIASAGKKDRDVRRADPPAPPAPYPVAGPDDGYPVYPPFPDSTGVDADWQDEDGWAYADADYARRFPSERAAIDACAREAEALGSRYGAEARLWRIDDVDRADREYRVAGIVAIDDARAERREDARFACRADDGLVTDFRFEERSALRD